MVVEGLACVLVHAEAIVFLIIVFEVGLSRPIGGAFDTEMVVRLYGEFAGASRRFEQCLRHDDGGGNTVAFLVVHHYISPLGNILKILLALGRLCMCFKEKSTQEANDKG